MSHGRRSVRVLGLLAAFAIAAPACASDETAYRPGMERELAGSYTSFGFDLFRELLGQAPADNVFISPSSIAFALAMTYNGAAGSTERAMAQTLRLGDMNRDEINAASKALTETLESPESSVELSVANSLWLASGFTFEKEFIGRNERYFNAGIYTGLDVDRINAWVYEHTNKKIDSILDSLSPLDIAVLVNAIYFKGIWERAFDPEQTREEDFHLLGGATKKLPLMHQSGAFSYKENDRYQAVSLPYGKGRMSMYVFLPAEGSELDEFYRGLSSDTWNEWATGFRRREGSLALPRFTVEYAASLKEVLIALGMGKAFSPTEADFTAMCKVREQNVYIDDVLHKTFIEVNEEGTEAAAVTAVKMKLTAVAEKPEPFSMIVDRPFFVAIRDNETGLVLFMGSIVDPDIK